MPGGKLLHRRHRGAARDTQRGITLNFRGRELVVARHTVGTGSVTEGRDRPDRHHLAGIVAGLVVADVICRQAIGFIRLAMT
jgi:hypothetical protein